MALLYKEGLVFSLEKKMKKLIIHIYYSLLLVQVRMNMSRFFFCMCGEYKSHYRQVQCDIEIFVRKNYNILSN